ncbi:LamG-like jellyroll fold domain-containing protein [Croceibacterium mercuriale]|uniref:LamG-like jellyroll fold domain-containing protein n=1 Tax=Croceibacterium mercuriale TaxID=1572751 RepID=UPI00068B19A9|nr:LamG-like jellyroll fold domain-containing protein [Croceibacterium mercuriale]
MRVTGGERVEMVPSAKDDDSLMMRKTPMIPIIRIALLLAAVALTPAVRAQDGAGLLFAVSADDAGTAQVAGGEARPIFARGLSTVADGAHGPALSLDDDLALAWSAPGNIQAQRGTLSFFLRTRTPLGEAPVTLFRVGAADGTSWDMSWLRIDWNGAGYDAFVTDTNLARTRVSAPMAAPSPDAWVHVAFAWDEQAGVRLWIDGRQVAASDRRARYDTGLFGFGPFQRIVSPYQVHSMYNFRRSGDLDELRIYDRMLDDAGIAALARNETPALPPLDDPAIRADWLRRHGWQDAAPPPLDAPVTAIRKVEFADTRDLKAKMLRGADGIRETTWPGVYNRSRLPGRDDYFQLPDWNVYSAGGRTYDLALPDEPWNRIELTGAAHGTLERVAGDVPGVLLRRREGVERTTTQLAQDRHGGTIRWRNDTPETPIQEIAAYHVAPGAVPQGLVTLSYSIDPGADPRRYAALAETRAFIAGRFVPAERSTVVALPAGAPRDVREAGTTLTQPVVHVLVPADFRDPPPGEAPSRFSYGWQNMDAGLDGIALDLPALDGPAMQGGLIPLNIRVRDPLWPARDLLDINVSVHRGEARTLWLDTRDRILTGEHSLMLSISAGSAGFDAAALAGARLRLVFKPAADAKAEHVADRLEQARDNLAFLVEEQPNQRLFPVWTRFERDISDVLRVDPGNALARAYWVEKNPEQPYAPLALPQPPAGVPAWAHWQTEQLKLFRRFVNWWIDERQVDNGEFGGGLSDDTDLVNQWVPLAAMGVQPDRLAASVRRLLDATYANGMWTGGLSRIATDELHSYEEGINSVAQAMQMEWGDPAAIERAMQVAREYHRLVEMNPVGHSHLVSSYFSGSQIYREGTLGWQRPFGFLLFHSGLLLVNWNGAPAVRQTVLSLLDGWLAHGEERDSTLRLPAEIEWVTDRSQGNGVGNASHLFWAAYDWTGDARYLRPLLGNLAKGDVAPLAAVNVDLLARVPDGAAIAQTIAGAGAGKDGRAVDRNLGGVGDAALARFVRWQQTGDTALLADLWQAEVATTTQRLPVLTEAHFWSDRVSLPSELLQRARLGGVAHRRNAPYPGNLVGWRFDQPLAAEDVGILVLPQGRDRFRVTAHNLSARTIAAQLIGAELPAGTWTMQGGVDADGDGAADMPGPTQQVALERGVGTALDLPPGVSVVYDFALVSPHDDPATRPDIGLSADDLMLRGRRLSVRTHSLGAQPTPAGTAIASDSTGHELARTRFPALAAPADLLPRTTEIALTLPRGIDGGMQVRLELDGAPREVTAANNQARLGDVIASRINVGR